MARLTSLSLNFCLFYSVAILLYIHAQDSDGDDIWIRQANSTAPITKNTYFTTTPEPDEPEFSQFDANVICKLQPIGYDCNGSSEFTARYYYDLKMEDCKTYDFGTKCRAHNKFSRLSVCHSTCREPGNKDIPQLPQAVNCMLQPDFGNCNEYFPRWYFDVTYRVCKGFSWSGCGGNANNFLSSAECLTECANIVKFVYKI